MVNTDIETLQEKQMAYNKPPGWRSTRTPRLGPLQRAAHAAIQRENRLQAANEKARRAAELKRLGISVKDETADAS